MSKVKVQHEQGDELRQRLDKVRAAAAPMQDLMLEVASELNKFSDMVDAELEHGAGMSAAIRTPTPHRVVAGPSRASVANGGYGPAQVASLLEQIAREAESVMMLLGDAAGRADFAGENQAVNAMRSVLWMVGHIGAMADAPSGGRVIGDMVAWAEASRSFDVQGMAAGEADAVPAPAREHA